MTNRPSKFLLVLPFLAGVFSCRAPLCSEPEFGTTLFDASSTLELEGLPDDLDKIWQDDLPWVWFEDSGELPLEIPRTDERSPVTSGPRKTTPISRLLDDFDELVEQVVREVRLRRYSANPPEPVSHGRLNAEKPIPATGELMEGLSAPEESAETNDLRSPIASLREIILRRGAPRKTESTSTEGRSTWSKGFLEGMEETDGDAGGKYVTEPDRPSSLSPESANLEKASMTSKEVNRIATEAPDSTGGGREPTDKDLRRREESRIVETVPPGRSYRQRIPYRSETLEVREDDSESRFDRGNRYRLPSQELRSRSGISSSPDVGSLGEQTEGPSGLRKQETLRRGPRYYRSTYGDFRQPDYSYRFQGPRRYSIGEKEYGNEPSYQGLPYYRRRR